MSIYKMLFVLTLFVSFAVMFLALFDYDKVAIILLMIVDLGLYFLTMIYDKKERKNGK